MKLRVVFCCCAVLSLMLLCSAAPKPPVSRSATRTKIVADNPAIKQWLDQMTVFKNKIKVSQSLQDIVQINDDVKKANERLAAALKGKTADKDVMTKINVAKREITQLWHTRWTSFVEQLAAKKAVLSAEERTHLQDMQTRLEKMKKNLESLAARLKPELRKQKMAQLADIGKRIDNVKAALAVK